MDPVDPPTTPPPIDEMSDTGALFQYNRRLLKIDEEAVREERERLMKLGELTEDGDAPGDGAMETEHRRLRQLFFTAGEYTSMFFSNVFF